MRGPDGVFRMYVSHITGIPDRREGHDRRIVHYTSSDPWHWLPPVIDSRVHPLPDGSGRHMRYKDEAHGSHT
ncbi:hypothetical protein [Streptomyces aurantiogriseus]|uniref:Uncharacterized protein n=1 Tax=Streptomyces aurantiogriseus TaxID=66870 RepID=A0A918FKJ7_9ACTN|nr:hypothetical protein [Streptomyces aurantiogriseus]GGR47476.1 hypothetical protein GCM10010251_75650 [Streptomyces aurantiogriseus]